MAGSNGDMSQAMKENSDSSVAAATLEEMRKARMPARRRFVKLEDELMALLATSTPDLEKVADLLREFLEVVDDLHRRDDAVVMEMGRVGATEEEEDAEYAEITAFRTKAKKIRDSVEQLTVGKPAQQVDKEPEVQLRKIKLPEIELEKFSGDLKDWLRFWAQFQRIHEDKTLSNTDKFFYLLQSCERGTEAYDVVASYPRSSQNYEKALEALKKRYGNENLQMQVFVRELLSLVISNVSGKNKTPFQSLYVQVDSNIRALESLNLAKADPATWLFPLVESALPEDVLYNWQRSAECVQQQEGKGQLNALLSFMEKEAQIRQRRELTESFTSKLKAGTNASTEDVIKKKTPPEKLGESSRKRKNPVTVMGFAHTEVKSCYFCGRYNHWSRDCMKAKTMSYDERMRVMRTKGLCFICTLPHRATDCRNKGKIKCDLCGNHHATVLCKELSAEKGAGGPPVKKQKMGEPSKVVTQLSNQVSEGDVCLQTLRVMLRNGDKEFVARVFLDSGSSRSYVLKKTIKRLNMTPLSNEEVIHELWGGLRTDVKPHRVYELDIRNLITNDGSIVKVRDEDKICSGIPRIDNLNKKFRTVLQKYGIFLSDVGFQNDEIELVIGGDLYGRIMTGRKVEVSRTLTAFETIFGWTIIGEVDDEATPVPYQKNNANITDKPITSLWELDLLGIRDSLEVTTETEREEKAKENFLKDVTRKVDGRYVIRLPWKEGHPGLPTNKEVSIKRLESTSRKLEAAMLLAVYNKLFKSWETESFIEVCSENELSTHYLPHRAVVKPESPTTPVRPVFDASCKSRGGVSLNDCLHKGKSYIQLIPDILLRFREKNIGFVSDIRKAFQMIEVHENDRNYLRFLWWKNSNMNELKIYRHKRVPFGATCSPFILGAILEYHLKSINDERKTIANRLWETLYVDNCCSSENTIEEYLDFKEKSIDILAEAKMDLRMWLSNVENVDDVETRTVSVLGMKWDRAEDEIFLDMTGIEIPEKITKRTVLSTISKVYDPIGFSSPAILPMKLLLQRAWLNKLKWDVELPEREAQEFLSWCSSLEGLINVRLPRMISDGKDGHSKWEIHTMTDGSKSAYGAVCYLVCRDNDKITVQLLAAKSRVAPAKVLTIPRMELLGCLIGARLSMATRKALKLEDVQQFNWTDSTTALAWIIRNDQWGTYVGNRTSEIQKLTNVHDWYHLPGVDNPADLPSRGCTPDTLLKSRWWEGPDWLKQPRISWPNKTVNFDEKEILQEKKITVERSMSHIIYPMYKQYKYDSVVRIQGWVRRFIYNSRSAEKRTGKLSQEEIERAEIDVLLSIQNEAFSCEKGSERLKPHETIKDEHGLIRVKSKLTYLNTDNYFKFPVVIPGEHPLVRQLMNDIHWKYCHINASGLWMKLREKFWVLKGRQSTLKVTSRCYRCRRHAAKRTVTESAPLPLDRIKDSEVFEVTGIDLAGPFFTKNGKKVWLVLYTCAVYRAVHLDLVTAVSTSAFIKSLQKFVEKYRRPAIIYSDNGTNFRGADNLFRELDWKYIQEQEGVSKIKWKFNPPAAAWWGGWWERLIRTIKDLLRKEIGTVILSQKELLSVLKIVEEVMNNRPLTYLTESSDDLEPLTPALFLNPLGNTKFPEIEYVDGAELRNRLKYMQMVKRDLKIRFKKEYLSLLVHRSPKKLTRPLQVGDLVFVGYDNKKRSHWPLGRILELIPGKDGIYRIARIRTKEGTMDCVVQRLYPLEADRTDPVVKAGEKITRSGRVIKMPKRLNC